MDNEMTPINRIMPNQSSSGMDDGDALVNEILSDVNQLHNPQPPSQGMSIRRPPPQRQQPPPEMLQQMEYDDEEDYMDPPSQPPSRRRPTYHQEREPMREREREPTREKDKDKDEDDFFKLILDNAKLPLIVGLLVLLMGMTYADDTLGKFIPSLMTSSGNLGFGGLVAKAITAGLLFYVLQRLLS
jgi:hypothetical protein